MLINFNEIIKITGRPSRLLHIGGYIGEESNIYKENDVEAFYVECRPDLFTQLQKNVGINNCCNYAVSSSDYQKVPFYQVESYDKSNLGCGSLHKPTEILKNPYLKETETIEVETITLNTLNKLYGPFDFLNCDVQGHELVILKHGTEFFKNPNLKGIMLEFTLKSLYNQDCLLSELDEFLEEYKFKRVYTQYADNICTWGDCLYVKPNIR